MRALILLLRCALNATAVDESLLTEVDMMALLKLAKSRSVAAMTCAALEKTETFRAMTAQDRRQWTDTRDRAVRKSILFDTERSYLFKEFENKGIRYMPLKGIITKSLYPAAGMREMADNDIWFDPARREEVKSIFLDHGYTVTAFGGDSHDVYMKEPFYNFELHPSLSEKTGHSVSTPFEDRLLRDAEEGFAYHFSAEDFYIYSVDHAHRHFTGYGNGIRALADFYVLNRNFDPGFDQGYVDSQLTDMGLSVFEAQSRRLAFLLFSPDGSAGGSILTPSEQELLTAYLNSSTYGDQGTYIHNALQGIMQQKGCSLRAAKIRYAISRAFPGRGYILPFAERHFWIIPFYWIWRFAYVIPKRWFAVRSEVRLLKKAQK